MNKEYLALKALEKDPAFTNSNIPPQLVDYKVTLSKFLTTEEIESMILDFRNKGYAKDEENSKQVQIQKARS